MSLIPGTHSLCLCEMSKFWQQMKVDIKSLIAKLGHHLPVKCNSMDVAVIVQWDYLLFKM